MRTAATLIPKGESRSGVLILIILLVASSFIHQSAFCQETYFSIYPVWYSSGSYIRSMVLGDVDRDGDLDFFGGSYGGVQLYLNTGGTFTSAWRSVSNQAYNYIAVGDVDGDGDLDLVAGEYGKRKAIYKNSGGTLETSPSSYTGMLENTMSIALGDVDGDGDLDLVSGNEAWNNTLYLNSGGTFESLPVWSSTGTARTQAVALGDVDGDGDLDLVCGNAGQRNRLYLNTGGTFQTTPFWQSSDLIQTQAVALGDVDGDGDLDLVCGNDGRSNQLYLNTGGTFESLPSWTSIPVEETLSIALGDVDGDGDLDLLCGNNGQSNTLYLNTGGTFQAQPAWISGVDNYTTWSMALGDVDSDGDLDLVCGNAGVSLYPQRSTLYSNTSGTFETSHSWSMVQNQDIWSITLGDVDSDGDLDLIRQGSQGTYLHMSSADTLEISPAWSPVTGVCSGPVALGDVDGDGDLDLVCGNSGLYLNAGDTFEVWSSWTTNEWLTPYSIALGDVDGDGDLDLVCGNSSFPGESNTLYLNIGGIFETSPSWTSEPTGDTRDIALGDVDGDGDLDLVCGNVDNGAINMHITIYLNIGGTFETSPSGSVGGGWTMSVALGDVDGDGDLDLACGRGGESNTLYLNTDGRFDTSPVWQSLPLGNTESIELGDVDGDGDLDLICGNTGEGNTIYLNTGGTFENAPSWSSEIGTSIIAAGDVDGDGDLDLAGGGYRQPITLHAGKAAPVYKGDPLSPANQLPNNGAHLRFVSGEKTGLSGEYRIDFTARDVESDPIWIVREYQYKGDPVWYPAVIGEYGGVGPFSTSPAGVRNSILWDTHLLPFDSRDVILRLRVIEIPARVSVVQHTAPYLIEMGPITPLRPAIAATEAITFPAITLGDTSFAVLSVANRGTMTLTITAAELSSTDMSLVNSLPLLIAPYESADLTIMLIPSSDTNIQETLTIWSDDPFSPSIVTGLNANVRPLDFTFANLYPTGEIIQGTPLNALIVMQDSVHVDSARVFYRQGGETTFASVGLQRTEDAVNDQYYGSIPAESVAERGIEYFVRVYNDRFSSERPVRRLRTRVKNMEFAGTVMSEQYGMLSLPLKMEGPILGVLSDDLGGVDNTSWRMWMYDDTAAAYAELPNETTTHFTVGRGYWLISREDRALDTGPAEGISTPTDAPFTFTLTPGWSMLGNPFAFPVAWDSVRVDSLSMTEAVQQGVIEPVWRWLPSTGGYAQDVAVLEPFEAYWVMNAADPPRDIILHVPPVESSAQTVLASRSSARTGEESIEWQIALQAACEEVVTSSHIIGIQNRARDTYDSCDRSEPPMSPGKGLSLYFPHMDWERRPGRYAVDIRGIGNEPEIDAVVTPLSSATGVWGHAWRFDIAKNFSEGTAGDEIVLTFQGLETLSEDLEIVLIDRMLERIIDLRTDSRYLFFQGARSYVTQDEARFELLVGSSAFVTSYGDGLPALPVRTVLHQNYPNPFNPSTLIRYELATAGRVRLRIYDVSGALVKALENRDREAGRYETGWDGTNERGEGVGSGVYFYVLETPDGRFARKMLCVK